MGNKKRAETPFLRWKRDRMAFRREAILLEDGAPFGDRMDAWQEEDFRALDSGEYQHAYLERPRGHSKTGDIGTEAVTQLILGPPGQELYCAAADTEQAGLLLRDVAGKFDRNPMLRDSVVVRRHDIEVKATKSRLRVLSSDAPSAYGLRPNVIMVDELAKWKDRELWDALYTSAVKRPGCRIFVITTAGFDEETICWKVRQMAESEDAWYFKVRGQSASWINREELERQRRTLPGHVFAREHECLWVPGVGAFLTKSEIDGVFAETLPAGAGPTAIGVDLGVARDRSVVSLVRRLENADAVIEHLVTHTPTRDVKVRLEDVEADVVALWGRYGGRIVLDPWQGIFMGQRLRERGIPVQEYPFTPDARRLLFGTLLDLIRSGKLHSRPHEDFRRELVQLEVQDKPGGWRVDHRPGQHDDHVVSVALALTALPHGVAVDFRTQALMVDRDETSREWVTAREAPW